MNKVVKTGILVILLVLPVLVYLFLKNFGKNTYSLPVYAPEIYDSTAVDKMYKIESVPDFKLRAQNGQYLTRKDMEGKIWIADFIFTRCKGICPKMTTQMTRVQDAIKDDEDIFILTHTVDPEHDSVQAMNDYASTYGAIPGKWFFLTGSKEDLYKLAYRGYSLPAMKEEGGPEEFLHSEKFILIDKKGRIRGFYDGTDAEEVDRLIMEISILQKEEY